MMNVEWRQAATDPQTRPKTRAVSLPVGCQKPHPPSLFIITSRRGTDGLTLLSRPCRPLPLATPSVSWWVDDRPILWIWITQLESWYSFYHPTEGRRLSRPRHCSKSAQPVPKAVYRSDVYDKHAAAHGGIRTLILSHRSQACYC